MPGNRITYSLFDLSSYSSVNLGVLNLREPVMSCEFQEFGFGGGFSKLSFWKSCDQAQPENMTAQPRCRGKLSLQDSVIWHFWFRSGGAHGTLELPIQYRV